MSTWRLGSRIRRHGPTVVALAATAAAGWVVATRGPGPGASLGPFDAATVLAFAIVGSAIAWLAHLTRTARVRAERAEHREQTVLDSIADAFVTLDFGW